MNIVSQTLNAQARAVLHLINSLTLIEFACRRVTYEIVNILITHTLYIIMYIYNCMYIICVSVQIYSIQMYVQMRNEIM